MRTTLDLPDPLFRTLKARAALDGTSLKDLVIRLVQRGLTEPTSVPVVERRPLPVLIPHALGLPLGNMSNADIDDLIHADDDAKTLELAYRKPAA